MADEQPGRLLAFTLVEAAQSGDTPAMAELLKLLTPYVARLCGPIALGNAPDATQEALIAIMKGLRGCETRRLCSGGLLVHVPSSAEAPHMVDYVYYGRGDRANVRLGDEQVRAIIESRRRGRLDVAAELLRMVDDDPIPGLNANSATCTSWRSRRSPLRRPWSSFSAAPTLWPSYRKCSSRSSGSAPA